MVSYEKITLGSVVVAILLTAAPPAAATPTFPARIAADLELANAPQCSLCHEGATQKGTVITPFGTSMRSRGLVAYDEASLANALLALEGEGTDSDGDGVGDIEELRQEADPNVGEGGEAAIIPEYGCSAGLRGGSASSWASSWGTSGAAFLLSLVALARRISRRRGQQ